MRTLLLTAMAYVLLLTTTYAATATHPPHVTQYIESYYEIAIREMHRSGIPASIILAQGIHESSWGLGKLSTNSNNHFGIKCKSVWTGPTFYIEDDDYQNGKLMKSCFRVYNSVEESYIDHTNFLVEGSRYQTLFNYDRTDYTNWAKGLKACGYATDPHYAEKLIRTIEKYNLTQYDEATPPIVSAPVFHIPSPEPLPQTALPQETNAELTLPNSVVNMVKPNASSLTDQEVIEEEAIEEEVVISRMDEEVPPPPVNIENYIRPSNNTTETANLVEMSSEDDGYIEEEEEPIVVSTNKMEETAIKEIYSAVAEETRPTISTPDNVRPTAQYQMTALPRTKQLKEEPISPNKLTVRKSDDSHLQLMKGKMRVGKKPRR